jgi:hypothetical protein
MDQECVSWHWFVIDLDVFSMAAAGQNYNLREAKGFLTAMMLVNLPIVVVGGLKAFMDDKVLTAFPEVTVSG